GRSVTHLLEVAEQDSFDELTEKMNDRDVPLLDSLSGIGGHHECVTAERCQSATVPARQTDSESTALVRHLYGAYDVGGIAAGADCQEQVFRADQGLHLACEGPFEIVVVGPAGQSGGVEKVV